MSKVQQSGIHKDDKSHCMLRKGCLSKNFIWAYLISGTYKLVRIAIYIYCHCLQLLTLNDDFYKHSLFKLM